MIIIGIDPGFGRIGYGIIDYTKNQYKILNLSNKLISPPIISNNWTLSTIGKLEVFW